ncbi:hypothetical protein CASFOL_021821 [Castilleja foliolosa]|uniref:GOLD domain-containing protein n=1 Tax=Castilleja foliolosa TaxID=1961234 RepID=A0ABD3CYJ7_9LAMI
MAAFNLWAVMLVVLPVARGIWLELPSNTVKCLSEDLRNNVLVMAEYYAFYGDHDELNSTSNPSVSIKVSSPHGNELHRDEKVFHGTFAFTTTESGSYQACFWANNQRADKNVMVGLEWRTGIATKD